VHHYFNQYTPTWAQISVRFSHNESYDENECQLGVFISPLAH
jgi:hypothetical protein